MSSSYLVTLSICVDANNHVEAAKEAYSLIQPDPEYAYFEVKEISTDITKEIDVSDHFDLTTQPGAILSKDIHTFVEPMTPFNNEWISYLAS